MAVEPASVIGSLVLLFSVSATLVYIFHRLGLPALLAYLFAGILLNPTLSGLLKEAHLIHILSEIGLIFLLFSIGLEFSLERLREIKGLLLKAGFPQVFLTVIGTAILAYLLLGRGPQAIFLGLLVALSSTAIVFKILSDRGDLFTPYGKMAVAILLFQDLCVVPFMLMVPLLGAGNLDLKHLGFVLLKTGFLILLLGMLSEKLIPVFFHQIVRTRSRELFITGVILFVLGVPFLSHKIGLSFSLGAFLAGLLLSRSEYAHQVLSEILPLRDTLIGFFFVSVGLLIDWPFLVSHLGEVLLSTLFVMGFKFGILLLVGYLVTRTLRVSLQTALALSQIGEFSFVLALSGQDYGLMPEIFYQLFLASAILTMLFTPLTVRFLLPRLYGLVPETPKEVEEEVDLKDHVIIVGFGVVGHNLARVLRGIGLPYVVIELNAETVRRMRARGEPIFFGDATSRTVLAHAGLSRARILVVAVSDPMAVRRIVAVARAENPEVHILVRTRFLGEVEELLGLGADEVVPEEFVSSVEILARVLHHYQLPADMIQEYVDFIRRDSYRFLRSKEMLVTRWGEILPQVKGLQHTLYLLRPGSPAEGRSLRELDFRRKTGATVVAIEREEKLLLNPDPELPLKAGDLLLIMGSRDSLEKALILLGGACLWPRESNTVTSR